MVKKSSKENSGILFWMNIKLLSLIKGAKQATGLTVIIDVFRAFSTACYVFNNGADKIIPVGDLDLAYKLKQDNPDYLLLGERGGKKPPRFDYGNSPTDIENVDFTNKTIIHTTTAGTQGIANAINADEIITGSFLNVSSVVKYIQVQKPKEVSLVAMGSTGVHIRDEDELCAKYIKNELEGKTNDFNKIKTHLKKYKSAIEFFDSTVDWAPEKDFDLCLALNKFYFVLKVENDKVEHPYFKRINI